MRFRHCKWRFGVCARVCVLVFQRVQRARDVSERCCGPRACVRARPSPLPNWNRTSYADVLDGRANCPEDVRSRIAVQATSGAGAMHAAAAAPPPPRPYGQSTAAAPAVVCPSSAVQRPILVGICRAKAPNHTRKHPTSITRGASVCASGWARLISERQGGACCCVATRAPAAARGRGARWRSRARCTQLRALAYTCHRDILFPNDTIRSI